MESSHTSPALALQFSAVVVAAAVVVSEELVVVASVGLAVVVEELEEQAPLTQDSPVAQEPVY